MPELFQDELFLWRNNSENITFHFLVFFLSGHWLRSIGYFSVGEMRSEPCQLFSFKPLKTRMTGEHMVLGQKPFQVHIFSFLLFLLCPDIKDVDICRNYPNKSNFQVSIQIETRLRTVHLFFFSLQLMDEFSCLSHQTLPHQDSWVIGWKREREGAEGGPRFLQRIETV